VKSLLRLALLALIAVVAVTPALGVHAQAPNCYGLSDADCKLAQGVFTSDSMAKLTSFVMDYKLAIKATGGPNGDANINITGTGPFAVDVKAASNDKDPMAAINAIMAGNVITADINAGTTKISGTFEWRLVNGSLYFKGDTLTGGKWMVISISDAMTAGMAMSSGAGSSASGGGPSGAATSAMSAFSDPDVLTALSAIPNIPGFITAAAADGPKIDDQATKQFTITFDLVKLVQAKEFRPIIKALATSANQGKAPTDAEIDGYAKTASAALNGSKFNLSWLVGTTDKLLHGVGLVLSFKLDAATAQLLMNKADATAMSADINFSIQFSKVGQPVKVDAVPDAQKFDLAGMMSGAAGMMPTMPAP
jgi:hypothetical protein